MEMEVDVVQQQQGPLSSKLIISVISPRNYKTIKISPEIIIKDLAVVHFQFRILASDVCERRVQKIACSISSRKYPSVCKDEIKMTVTCQEKLIQYSEQWMCTEDWSSWKEIGSKSYNAECQYVYHFIFEVDINMCVIAPSMFAKLYDDKDFTDFRLSSGEGSVAVHKACLASHSEMFKTMLANEWKESAECHIQPEGGTLQTLQDLKDYLYLGSLQERSLRQLLLIAKRYKIKNLKAECILGLARRVTSADLFDLLEFSRENEIRELTLALIELTPIQVVESISQSLKQL